MKSKTWTRSGTNNSQKRVLDKYDLNNDEEHDKLEDLFNTLHNLTKIGIELSDFQDNIYFVAIMVVEMVVLLYVGSSFVRIVLRAYDRSQSMLTFRKRCAIFGFR